MNRGFLAEHFTGIAVKQLSAVEANSNVSNQHEFNGTVELQNIFGSDDCKNIPTRFLWIGEDGESISEDGFLSWYDSRRAHATRTEYRLYFNSTAVSEIAGEGDTLFIARRADQTAMVIVTPAGASLQSQLLWLFGLPEQPQLAFSGKEIVGGGQQEIDFASRFILDELGIEFEEPEADRLDELLRPYGNKFPTTAVFSKLARDTSIDVSAVDDPDRTLLAWMKQEEALFRQMERGIVSERLRTGFHDDGTADVDGFLKFSLSVQNRRKSRAGYALGNHIEAILIANGVRHKREATTEKRNGPDFLFPSEEQYHDPDVANLNLRMLGAKTSCKDRWRQVLAEADRISPKHLLTLEPSISETQTNEMRGSALQLVIPRPLFETYGEKQQDWLMDFREFLELVG